MIRLAIASGKGGTGKTTLAAHLAAYLGSRHRVRLLDLDVEAPDSHAYFEDWLHGQADIQAVSVQAAQWRPEACSHCGLCGRLCNFGAITALPDRVLIDHKLCKGCGRCVLACPSSALTRRAVAIGQVEHTGFREPNGQARLELLTGRLKVGDIRSTAVIAAVQGYSRTLPPGPSGSGGTEYEIRDCPPGCTCPSVRAIHGADACILVAEPTAFSLHDLEKALTMVQNLGIPAGIVINKAGAGTARPERLARDYGIPIIGRLDWRKDLAQAGARADLSLHSERLLDCLCAIESALPGLLSNQGRQPAALSGQGGSL